VHNTSTRREFNGGNGRHRGPRPSRQQEAFGRERHVEGNVGSAQQVEPPAGLGRCSPSKITASPRSRGDAARRCVPGALGVRGCATRLQQTGDEKKRTRAAAGRTATGRLTQATTEERPRKTPRLTSQQDRGSAEVEEKQERQSRPGEGDAKSRERRTNCRAPRTSQRGPTVKIPHHPGGGGSRRAGCSR